MYKIMCAAALKKYLYGNKITEEGAYCTDHSFSYACVWFSCVLPVGIGYRADDSYFSFARAFIGNEISLNQLSYAMRLGKLGEQIVLKSPAAFDAIQFLSYVGVDNTEYYARRKARDDEARAAYRAGLEKDDLNGLYMRDILREELTPDDPRLR